MPDTQFGAGSAFDLDRGRLSSWLRANMENVCPLPPRTIGLYNEKGKGIIAGWEVTPPGSDYSLRILLDDAFPFAHIKIAYVGECRYLQWPHVEENGFLCLPISGWRPIEDLVFSIRERVSHALQLLDDCQSDEYVKSESAKEFLSYWGRSAPPGARALSLVDLSCGAPRAVSAVKTDKCWLVADDKGTIDSWLINQGQTPPSESLQAVFASVESPPALPLPGNARQFLSQIIDQSPQINSLISQLSIFEPAFLFLAVQSNGSAGLIGARLSPIQENGFQKLKQNGREPHFSARRNRAIWACFSQLTLFRVERADSDWVHGRGLDPTHQILANKRLVVLGCGSLGSQVAARLSQVGVGHITIIDPEHLKPSNVGRHFLGMESVERGKAKQLASTLCAKYPHGSFHGIGMTYQAVLRESPDIFKDADLVVSCIAEADQDQSWDAWQQSEGLFATTVYGWLGTQGSTGHALALTNDGPGISCFFDPDGFLWNPDTDFQGDTRIKVEPGCGTEFQPYGPLAAGQVELLVSRLCLDILTKKVFAPHHRIYACSTNDLTELGGQWTNRHGHYRPDGYEGPFEYISPVSSCGDCYQCRAQ